MKTPLESLSGIIFVKDRCRLVPTTKKELEENPERGELVENPQEELERLQESELETLREEIMNILIPEAEVKSFTPSKFSPLPAIQQNHFDSSNDNYNLLKFESRIEGVHWLALLDLDNTLYEAESKHSIILHHFADFLQKKYHHIFQEGCGSLRDLKELIDYCERWEKQRNRINNGLKLEPGDEIIEYEDGIDHTGKLSAAAFAGLEVEKLQRYGREFIIENPPGRFFDYTPDVIQKLRDHGLLPVIVTGAPDFLLPAILEKLGIAHGNGMTYEEKEGRLTGKVKVNLGTARAKGEHGKKLTEKGYAIAFAMGDSVGDMGPISCALFTTLDKQDVHGGAVVVHATETTKKAFRRPYRNQIDEERLRIVEKGEGTLGIQAAVGITLTKLFEPLHEYAKLKRDTEHPERLQKYEEDLIRKMEGETEEDQKGEHHNALIDLMGPLPDFINWLRINKKRRRGKTISNIENIKRIRDVLRKEGLNEKQIFEELKKFYPDRIVEGVMKSYMLDTRNENDVKAWLNRIGAQRKTVSVILDENRRYNLEHGSLIPVSKRRSSIPPKS